MSKLITHEQTEDLQDIINNGPFPIRFPPAKELSQDEEWCEVKVDDKWKRIRFHDYHEVFQIPGLYETIFYRTLMCNSPNRIAELFHSVLIEQEIHPHDLRILDFGAGNGMSGEALHSIGARKIVAADLLKEAKEANWRDRPWVYEDYITADFTQLSQEQIEFFKSYKFNTLLTVAALGFGDIPPLAFSQAFNFVENGGFLVFNIRDKFLKLGGRGPFVDMIQAMIQQEIIQIELYKRYRHRLNTRGEPLYYVAIVAKKNKDIPKSLIPAVK